MVFSWVHNGGEGGIRTLGSGLAEQQISSLSLSTTQTPLHLFDYNTKHPIFSSIFLYFQKDNEKFYAFICMLKFSI